MGFLTVFADFPGHFVAMLILLALSAYFSMAETALFNLSRDELRRFRASGNPLWRLAARLMDDPRQLLVTVLLGSMLVNTAFFVTGVMLIDEIGGLHPAYGTFWRYVIGTGVLLAVIIVGEIIPKSVAAAMPRRLAPLAGLPLTLMGYVARPVRTVLGYAFVVPITRLVSGARRQEHSYVTTDELQAIIEVAAREGAVTSQEGDMLADILELGELKVREVMQPRVEIFGCDIVTPMPVVLAVFRRMKLSKMVVYEHEMDNMVGMVYAKTAYLNPGKPLDALVRPVYYVPETKSVESLLRDFRARKIQFAVVVDEYGGVSGIVSLEDCLEQIVGAIEDETDQPAAEPVRRVSDTEYVLAGNLSIRSWAEAFDLDVPDEGGRYSTVAGFLTSLLGRLPRPGDTVRWRNLQFTVSEVRHHRVTRVGLKLLEQPAGAGAGTGAGADGADAGGGAP
jgi:CBS domain containing-hemolysin-like protein